MPFPDLTSQKRRPVVVVSNNVYNRKRTDVVVVAMTSSPAVLDDGFRITSQDLAEGRLNRPGMVRADKIYTLSQAIVVKSSGAWTFMCLTGSGACWARSLR